MFFYIIRTKKGVTFVELMIVVMVLGILTAFAVPVFVSGLEKQRIKDCKNQATVVQASVEEAMFGMFDNGKKQPKIDFTKISQADHATTYTDDGVKSNGDDVYAGKPCFVLGKDQALPGVIAFTLGDLRGGYRSNEPNAVSDYNEGFAAGHYLKKYALKDVKFYTYLSNQEIPVCPFADYTDNDKTNDYHYFIFEDGTVICSCPKCH